MSGLHKFNIYKVRGFTKNINGINEIHLKGKRLDLIGNYILRGQILILPVRGDGAANVTIINPNIHLIFTGSPSIVEGKTYMQTYDLKVTFSVDRLIFHFDNLYNGDKALGDTTNRFINEYWRDIYLEIKPSLLRTFEEQIQVIANTAMAKLPFDEYFLK
ncbi:Protein takeout [Pseudolycoriella hygida]|uniref:Protein takeout n=1 Tax=Pseudolycoriella hygida TaxID=35572 RepID=A0A9Q0MQ03_9DIPT|nr:Protein takeout [Pseudolycoriella hygida]